MRLQNQKKKKEKVLDKKKVEKLGKRKVKGSRSKLNQE